MKILSSLYKQFLSLFNHKKSELEENLPEGYQRVKFTLNYLHPNDVKFIYNCEKKYRCNLWPCNYSDIETIVRQAPGNGIVVKVNGHIIGYVLYNPREDELVIVSICIDKDYRRQGWGSELLKYLLQTPDPYIHRSKQIIFVRESNLGAQLFLKSMGFLCIKSEKDLYEDPEEDALLFEHIN